MEVIAGIDIGGTKCAVSFIHMNGDEVEFLSKEKRPTNEPHPDEMVQSFVNEIAEKLNDHPDWELVSIGISCGGPLDEEKGLILCPPNLPHWDHIDLFTPLKAKFGDVPIMLQNDANACALAEWQLGTGKGCRNMIFLTFGTGLGAGLILNGELYSGTNGMAGEAGHIRLAEDGPVGYGKEGSFEGFCSGGGIAQLGQVMAEEALDREEIPSFCQSKGELFKVNARTIAEAAEKGDPLALKIYDIVADRLGQGLAILVDLLNPEKIVIGSIFLRQEKLLRPRMEKILNKEALGQSVSVVEVVPAGLGEKLGDYAAVSVGLRAYQKKYHIVGELMKGFKKQRPVPADMREKLGEDLADHLQGALPAISLAGHAALSTAFLNDVAPDMVFAQQVYGYGNENDVLLAITTSGNSGNVLHAVKVAQAKNMKTIGLTGPKGGKLKEAADTCICVPGSCTADIQELHLPVYHALCAMLEERFFE